jgi:hypothetical protein
MRLVQIKNNLGIALGRGAEHMGTKADIYAPSDEDLIHKNLPGLLLEPLHHKCLDISFQHQPTALQSFVC